jgi:hypothetical protein
MLIAINSIAAYAINTPAKDLFRQNKLALASLAQDVAHAVVNERYVGLALQQIFTAQGLKRAVLALARSIGAVQCDVALGGGASEGDRHGYFLSSVGCYLGLSSQSA